MVHKFTVLSLLLFATLTSSPAYAEEPEQQSAMTASEPTPTVGYDHGVYVRDPRVPFSFVVNGFGQARYIYTHAQGAVDGTTNFAINLARLSLSGSAFTPALTYFTQVQAATAGNTNALLLIDWWAKYQFAPGFALKAGRYLLPFTRGTYTVPQLQLIGEVAGAEAAFNLPRGIGAGAMGTIGKLSYDLAVLNSVSADGTIQNNRGAGTAALLRLELAILEPYGYLETSPEPVENAQLSVGVAGAYNPVAQNSATQNTEIGDNTATLTADLGFRVGGFTLQGSYFIRQNNRVPTGISGGDWGYWGHAAFYVVREHVEIALRTSTTKFLNRAVKTMGVPTNLVVGDTQEYTGAVNLYLHGHNAKVQANYTLLQVTPFAGASLNDHRVIVQTQVYF